jgi:Acetyltransferases, including N-acetylases of ribosomal proteins
VVEPLRLLSTAAVDPLPSGRFPLRTVFRGRWATLEPLDPALHGEELFTAAGDPGLWTWLPYGPFANRDAFTSWLRGSAGAADPVFFAVREAAGGRAQGMLSLLNIRPADGVAELGHIWLAGALQRTAAATDALTLLLRHLFDDLGYRRLEWKCNAANVPSRRAAERLGFRFEGTFYRHMIVKGGNRDTAWFSLLSDEWPERRAALDAWLEPANFDAAGRQRRPLRRAG